MVFKVIDGNLTSIFKKTQNIANGFNIASNSINLYANAFNRLNTQQNFGTRWDTFLSGMDKANPKLVTYFQDLAKQGASARASIQDMYAVLLDGNTRGIGNVKSVISAFNQVNPANQQAFAQAVGQTNAQLGIYLGNLNGANASMKGYAATLVGATVKTVALQAASMALNATISFGVSIAISGLISWITSLVNWEQEAIDKANEAAQAIKEQEESLDEYINKIIELRSNLEEENITQQESIDIRKELADIQDDLIDKYGKEAESISLVTGNIQDQIFALYKLNKAKYNEEYNLNTSGYNAAVKNIQNQTANLNYGRFGLSYIDDSTLDSAQTKNISKYVIQLLQKYGFKQGDNWGEGWLLSSDAFSIDETLSNLQNEIKDYFEENSDKWSDNVKDKVTQTLEYLSSVRSDWSNKVVTDNEELYSQWLKYDSDYSGSYIELIRKQANLEYTIETGNAEDIAKARAEFTAVYTKATEEAIKNGDTDVAKYLEKTFGDVIETENDVIESNANTALSVTSLADTFQTLKEALEDIIDYADTYQSAMAKISAGTALTAEEVAKLLEIDPTLYDKFTKTKDGWQIDYSYLRDSRNENVTDTIAEKVGGTKEEFETALEQGNSRLEELQKQRNEILSKPIPESAKQEQLKYVNEQIKNVEDVINNSEQGINLTDFYSKLFNFTDSDVIMGAFDDVIDKIDEYNDNITSLNNSIDTLNEGNSLSYDEMTGLVNLYPQLQDKVVKTTNGYAIEKSALEDVRIQSYKTRNDYIDNQIAQTKAAIEQTKARMETYTHEIALISSASAYKAALESGLLEQYWNDERTIKSMEELIKLFESYKSEVLDPDNDDSSKDKISDKLQNQIDYYKMLLEAIGIVSDKVVEGLEKEKDAIDQKIDALNDEKDALQEKNDEQQRELDLIEAKNNLDKAKKQKVFVYKEGQGLVQVQDEKAVADAQKEYDDIQREIEIANIDKQIDVYDKQKEAIEDQIDAQQKYGEQFTNMESDIQDTLTVEQAKKALGTDENGLLSLDNKTINGIRDGLATATYNKDVEDNKENSKYVTVKLEDFLKSVGATVTPTEFKAMASTITNNPANIIPATNANSTINNAQTINNKTANFNATFNIYDALDPYKIIDTVKKYFNGVLKQTINSVK